MRIALVLLTGLPFLACAATAAPTSPRGSLIQTLTPEEFARAGLNKLSTEELSFLEEALARREQGVTAAAPAAPAESVIKSNQKAASSFGAEQVTEAKREVTGQELHARIEGTIESFSGRAVFVLDNGQIWQQRIPDAVYFTPKLVNPEVIITRGFIGYKMLIVPANRIVFVKRVQ